MATVLLRIPEVARVLGVSSARAYQLARDGVLPVVRLGRQVRVDEQTLRRWIAGGGQALPGGWQSTESNLTNSRHEENPN